MSTESNHPFVMFPTRIWNLPGITLQLLKFYEKIFQFWHQGYECFLSNKTLMEYSGMKSDSTVRDAFTYFEKQGELKRINKNGQRYIIPPTPKVLVNNLDTPSATALPPQRHSDAPPSATALPNNINIIKQNNKSFCASPIKTKSTNGWNQPMASRKAENAKKPDWADPKKAPLASVESQSTSFDKNRMLSAPEPSPHLIKYMKRQFA